VALGWRWGDPVAGIVVTLFICHVGYEVTTDVVRQLADGVDPGIIHGRARGRGPAGHLHVHARARWTGRRLRAEIEAWVDPALTLPECDALSRHAAAALAVRFQT